MGRCWAVGNHLTKWRCRNDAGESWFCHQHKRWLVNLGIWLSGSLLVGLMTVLLSFYLLPSSPAEKKTLDVAQQTHNDVAALIERPPVTRQDVDDIKRQLADLYELLPTPNKPVNEKYEGLSVHIVAAFHSAGASRRQYVLDVGHLRGPRLSMYFDATNIFTLAMMDAYGEVYAVKVPAGPSGVPLDQFIYLACEVGIRSQSTYLKVVVNGREVDSLELRFRADPVQLDLSGAVLGADLAGNNGAHVDIAELMVHSATLTTVESRKLIDYFKTRPLNSVVSFQGIEWMRVNKAHD